MSREINDDLIRERERCTFDLEELTHIVDGGPQMTKQRHEIEKIVLQIPELKDPVPEEYLSHKEKYENAIRKACYLMKALKEHVITTGTIFDTFVPSNTFNITWGVNKDFSPFTVHIGMFIPTILGQASPEQQARWLPRAFNMEIIGTYAQTELGHGTFLRGLETTATYDTQTEEFILHSPTLTSYKWWPAGLGHTANYSIVVAQLISRGQNHGIHTFYVQIRDEETHRPLPGVNVGEIGSKLGFSTGNNGFLGFNHCRIPREAMLAKNARVLKDGSYVKSSSDKLTYGTLVLIRVLIVTDMGRYLATASTIAVRYSAVRHQSKIKEMEAEPQILDYVTQQHKLFIAISTSHAFRVTGLWLWKTFQETTKELKNGNMDRLPELHALACCLKAVSTKDASTLVEQCRLACGGHGYMASSFLPALCGLTTAAITYEGENTVLLLQTARFLVKSWELTKRKSNERSSLIQQDNNMEKWNNTSECIIRGMKHVATGHIKSAVEVLQKNVKKGMAYEDAWNAASVQLILASEAHCRAVLCEVYWNETKQISSRATKNLSEVLLQLAELYLIYWALEKIGDLLQYSNISGADIVALRSRYGELLAIIRPNAVGLVDAFDLRDEILHSTLGAYDGRVYERLMEEALKSPLNSEPVNESFHKYLKPFMQGKL